MTCDPYDYRCRRCHVPMEDDREFCGRGDCRSDLEALREFVARWCRRVLGAARRLGLVE